MKSFIDIQQEAFNLVKNKKYGEVLDLLENAKKEFPLKMDRIGHWCAGIHILQDNHGKALEELRDVLNHGLWWNPVILQNDPDLNPIKNSKEFSAVIKDCTTSYQKEKKEASAYLEVKGNQESPVSLLALHWKGSNSSDFADQWDKHAIHAKYLTAYLQSSQLFSYNCYSWDDYKTAEKDIRSNFQEYQKKYSSRNQTHIIAGASQGGKTAIEFILQEKKADFKGFIAVVPSFTNTMELEEALNKTPSPKIKGCVITGTEDPFYEQTLQAVEMLNDNGINCRIIVKEGMGHTLPNDFSSILQEAVEEIMLD
ncbi:hypothetical protein [Halobacillus massiliensis]|uniref:hypothetical protein n=1 Tax=Halobacillus massiliensis TaxID=1926286 RepID=UPI0009E1DE73|nr:hypothetical protein [Halobacillus massiliensis]